MVPAAVVQRASARQTRAVLTKDDVGVRVGHRCHHLRDPVDLLKGKVLAASDVVHDPLGSSSRTREGCGGQRAGINKTPSLMQNDVSISIISPSGLPPSFARSPWPARWTARSAELTWRPARPPRPGSCPSSRPLRASQCLTGGAGGAGVFGGLGRIRDGRRDTRSNGDGTRGAPAVAPQQPGRREQRAPSPLLP